MTASTREVSLRPFRRLPFANLPERPARPHPYFDSTAHELRMESDTLGPLRIHYREYGAGEPLLLLHGLMTSSYSWRYVLDGLGQHYRLIIPDLPGAGSSSAPARRRLAPEALASWIGEFQVRLEIRGCPVVANSLGGNLAMRQALRDPSAFYAMVNIHSPGVPMSRLHALHPALSSLPGAEAVLRWWIRRDPARWAHRSVHYYDETLKSLEEVHRYGDPFTGDEGVGAFVDYLRDVMAPAGFADFDRELARRRSRGEPFPVPLQLIYANQDPLVPPGVGERLAELIPDAELCRLDRSSHFAHVDTPAEVTDLVLRFLRTH
ncbi:alpha/beta fold hydrolase [Nocardia sp. BMG51109]|uniref:alpha/beta fold hydrolase n=1 Tax=Nocardia sp. BMG51109 TaxID=1056816 RepID=UPI0004B7ACBB|nr:alpha/beta fold hydrolase [Nocardia sp. BMG51109]